MDLDKRVWTLPSERMKVPREHRVPLSDPAIAILKHLQALKFGEFVFPGAREGKPLSNMAMLKTLERMKRRDITVHGFRSTFRTWAAEQTSYPGEVVEGALAHVVGNKVEAAYQRSDLLEKRRTLMDEWARYCSE